MNTDFNFPDAGPIRRVLALAYDTLMVAAISLVYALIISIATVAFTALSVGDAVVVYDQLWYQLGFVAVNGGFFIYFWRHGGQTIGMRAWRLKLIDENTGGTATMKQCVLRCVLAPISIVCLGAGYWWGWFDEKGCAAHDRLTKTRVLLLPKKKQET